MRLFGPRQNKIRTMRYNHQHPPILDIVADSLEQLEGRWICPMHVFEYENRWLSLCTGLQQTEKGTERLVL